MLWSMTLEPYLHHYSILSIKIKTKETEIIKIKCLHVVVVQNTTLKVILPCVCMFWLYLLDGNGYIYA